MSIVISAQRKSAFFRILGSGLVIAIALGLVGCENAAISAVKESYVDNGKTLTAAQLLNNRQACGKVTWRKLEDNNGRTVVEYKCTFPDSDDFLASNRENYIVGQKAYNTERINRYKLDIAKYEDELSNLVRRSDGDELRNFESTTAPKPSSDHYNRLIAVRKQLIAISNEYSESAYVRFLLGDDFKWALNYSRMTDEHADMIRFFRGFIGPLERQFEYMESQSTPADRANYKKNNIDRYLQRMRAYIDELGDFFAGQIAREEMLEEEERQRAYALEELNKEGSARIRQDMIDILKERIEESNKYIAEHEDKINGLKEQSEIDYPRYEGIVETFQWVVNRENKPTLISGQVVALSGNPNENKIIKHHRGADALEILSQSDAINYREYLRLD
ncbi:hypothetical protein ACSBPQ_11565 [Stenotrophomonas sp. JC08]|uniref:hypothetical protein n=1 Tax=Stenotrophomonas sp. JC08 TaxID=3445779 RepID=UPI003FA224BC